MGLTPWQKVEGFEFDHIIYKKKQHTEMEGWVGRIAFNRPEGYISFGRFQTPTRSGEHPGTAEAMGYREARLAYPGYCTACLASLGALYGRPGRTRCGALIWQGNNPD